ncbi:MAG: hypothetical protein ABIN25_01945 [Ginsengibacter sp.]
MYKDKKIWLYLLKFIGVFCLCYFGTLNIIGLAAPGNYYSPFVAKNLDYVSWIKISLMKGTEFILSFFSIQSHSEPGFLQRINNGRGVIIAMDCVGYGVYSFWIAFIVANNGTLLKKTLWIIAGVMGLWLINVIRISLFLVAINRNWPMPLGIDHHTWFNIFAYMLIFTMIWLYDRSSKENKKNTPALEMGEV